MKILTGLLTCAALGAALLFAPTPASAASVADAPIVGGWAVEDGSAKLTRAEKKLFNRAMETRTDAACEPLLLLGRQVVAGTNYCYLARTEANRPELKLVYIYENLTGELEILGEEPLELGL